MTTLDLSADAVTLTEQLVNIESVSRNERAIADAVESALRTLPHLTVTRRGHTVVARTDLGHGERVVIAGHLDTVPLNDNLPARREGDLLHGLGTCDMKGGDAVILRLAATVPAPNRDVTYILYEAEEIESEFNGLTLLAQSDPELMVADFAILMEPSGANVEGGCQGTMRVDVRTTGERAHSARSWKGVNAIHGAADVLARLNAFEARLPVIDGLEYHEGLNAVFISGGVAGNVLPDECVVSVNYRFAPDRSEAEAEQFLRDFFDGYDVTLRDSAPGALPGLGLPAAKAFVEAVGGDVRPEVRLDRRGTVQRPRRTGRQLRSRRPDARAQAGGACPGGPHRAVRAAAAPLAGRRVVRSKFKGPVTLRRKAVDEGTTDQRLLDSRGPSDWVHTDPWRVLRIQAEFIEGFGALAELGPAISVFGSARTKPEHPNYAKGEQVGRALVEAGFGVITGGGPGVMEAANKGASEAGGVSSGSASSSPSRQDSTTTSTSASTSATSSPARRCS